MNLGLICVLDGSFFVMRLILEEKIVETAYLAAERNVRLAPLFLLFAELDIDA